MAEELVLRKCEVLSNIQAPASGGEVTGTWKDTALIDVKKGQIFRLFEPDGEPTANGEISFAVGDAYEVEPPGNAGIQSEPLAGW